MRGLKPIRLYLLLGDVLSHPLRVRGLKPKALRPNKVMLLSHPLRVRGLKLQFQHACLTTVYVASFTGAWIETPEAYSLVTPKVSHPLRVRGLKLIFLFMTNLLIVASFTGAWIETFPSAFARYFIYVASFTGAWIETSFRMICTSIPGRILYGCVD